MTRIMDPVASRLKCEIRQRMPKIAEVARLPANAAKTPERPPISEPRGFFAPCGTRKVSLAGSRLQTVSGRQAKPPKIQI